MTAVVYYLSIKSKEINTCHHARFDDTTLLLPNSMGQKLIDIFKNSDITIHPVPYVSYAETMSPFDPINCFSNTGTIPPSGPLGLTWTDDNNFGISLILKMN